MLIIGAIIYCSIFYCLWIQQLNIMSDNYHKGVIYNSQWERIKDTYFGIGAITVFSLFFPIWFVVAELVIRASR